MMDLEQPSQPAQQCLLWARRRQQLYLTLTVRQNLIGAQPDGKKMLELISRPLLFFASETPRND
jgi:hypothetical protein